jgi:threonine aldolase
VNFASDNEGPVAPEIITAIAKANHGYASAYGTDPMSNHVRDMLRNLFEAPDAVVHFVTTGTAANALILASLSKPWDAIFCHRDAHIDVHECGAPEFFTGGAKLVALEGPSGKIDPEALKRAMKERGAVDQIATSRGPVSLTQLTDMGAAYSVDQIAELTEIARSFGSATHMDGTRFANALVSIGGSPAEMTWKAGVDALSFGGTKNGLMGAEAVIFFDPELAHEFEKRRLRGAHMISKQRFIAAQYQAYLSDGLWLDLARRANQAAANLEQGLADVPGLSLLHPRNANMIFAKWPIGLHRAARRAGAVYHALDEAAYVRGHDDDMLAARLVCNWATSDQDIAAFVASLKG